MHYSKINRRNFLKVSAATAGLIYSAGLMVPLESLSKNRPRIGLIGCGWQGKILALRTTQLNITDLVAICDVDTVMLTNTAQLIEKAQVGIKLSKYSDFRKMLKQEKLDIVIIATPDHWHSLCAIESMKAGADVYLEKPISVDIEEGLAMLRVSRETKRKVQVGTQLRSTHHLIKAREEVIIPGLLGKIGLVEAFSYKFQGSRDIPQNLKVPASLDFDLWTGPAPYRDGYAAFVHPRHWRGFMEFGNGIIGDVGVHYIDLARWMLNLKWPHNIVSFGGNNIYPDKKPNVPDTQTAIFDFKNLQMIWQHRAYGNALDSLYPYGIIIHGSKGTLKANIDRYDFIPKGSNTKISNTAVTENNKYPEDKNEVGLGLHIAPAIRSHLLDFFLSRNDTKKTNVAPLSEGHISTSMCILANISLQLGRSLAWDSENAVIINDKEANKLLRREYRKPWSRFSK